ncbi:MAG: hypothetical protein MRECE_19c025 [Mycoplasmataceae bacterium CE_OT135]|nr:MAG: hypothetical protein MRECE_19c025 [Mycoplasmataceae bacterium CE_OT135]
MKFNLFSERKIYFELTALNFTVKCDFKYLFIQNF